MMVHRIIERPNLQNKVSTENSIYNHLELMLFEEVQFLINAHLSSGPLKRDKEDYPMSLLHQFRSV